MCLACNFIQLNNLVEFNRGHSTQDSKAKIYFWKITNTATFSWHNWTIISIFLTRTHNQSGHPTLLAEFVPFLALLAEEVLCSSIVVAEGGELVLKVNNLLGLILIKLFSRVVIWKEVGWLLLASFIMAKISFKSFKIWTWSFSRSKLFVELGEEDTFHKRSENW